MNKSEESISQPVWNQAELLDRIDNDQELLRELLTIFKEDFPQTIRSLGTAIASGDLKSSAALSHMLKGMLSNLGGTRAAAAAGRLEQEANAGEKLSLKESFVDLERESASLLPEFDAYMTEVRH